MNIFEELKRRNVFKVGIAYAVASWVLLQIIDLVLENINSPGWVMQVFMLGLAVGFPIAVIVAWAFELTPDGLKREADVDRSQSVTAKTGHKLNWYIIGFLVFAVSFLLYERISKPVSTLGASSLNTTEVGKSIAVLPFVNMSADKDNEYFSDGLSEELLNLLAKVDGLKVAARTSSFKFKGTDADIAEIGNTLGVATVLEGSVRKSGNRARITAQLIKVDDGFHLWSETYDRNLDNIFAVQDEIALAIVDALKLPLLGADASPVETSKTQNFAAYDFYLLGRNKARETTAMAFQQAIGYFKQSIAADPDYAPAHSGLADAYIYLANYGGLSLTQALTLANAAVKRALELDSELVDANASKGLLLRTEDNRSEAEQYFKKALTINPNHVLALRYYSDFVSNAQKTEEALALSRKALALDPLSDLSRFTLIGHLIAAKQSSEAEAMIQAMIAENPENPFPYEAWGNLYMAQGSLAKAVSMYRTAHRLRPGDTYMAWQNVIALLLMDDLDAALEWMQKGLDRGEDSQWMEMARLNLLTYQGDWQALLSFIDEILMRGEYQADWRFERAKVLADMGRLDEARAEYKKTLVDTGYKTNQPIRWEHAASAVYLALLLDQDNEQKEFTRLLSQLDQLATETGRQSQGFELYLLNARISSLQGHRENTLAWLKKSIASGFRNRSLLQRDSILIRWAEDPEYLALTEQLTALAAQQRKLLEKTSSNNYSRRGF
ncbi:MAG: hypothetical protein IMF09_11580 [Proteobacteria bacterium]|nr:hypothetical protein [Pseudomonadota bacterium]